MAKTLTINGHLVRSVTLAGANVKAIGDGVNTLWEENQTEPNYFYFEDRSGENNRITISKSGEQTEWLALEYSTDKITWTSWNFANSISLPANGKVYLRGNNQRFSVSGSNYHNFGSSGDVYAGGSVISLFDKTVPSTINSQTAMFCNMFSTMRYLVGVDTNLFAGIDYGSAGSWRDTSNIFYGTFSACTSLLNAPDLSAVGCVRQNTFRETFNQCTALRTAAVVNVTESVGSATNHFRSMYWRCTSLTDASPMRVSFATANAYTFYQCFMGDTNLVTPPDLSSITTLESQAMYRMFYNCTSLTSLKVGFTQWGSESSSAHNYQSNYQWTYNVNTVGRFECPATLPLTRNSSDNTTTSDFIPSGWMANTDWFYIENLADVANTVTLPKTGSETEWVELEYSLDKTNWDDYDLETGVSVPVGGKLYLRGNNNAMALGEDDYHTFTCLYGIKAGGKAISLLSKDLSQNTMQIGYAFSRLFENNTHLLNTETELFDGFSLGTSGTNTFQNTFAACSNLQDVCSFSGITTVTESTFNTTYRECSNIVDLRGWLPNYTGTYGIKGFYNTFKDCTSLLYTPTLTISATAESLCQNMFRGCTRLEDASSITLSATTLDNNQYSFMFYNCSNLRYLPTFTATTITLGTSSMESMFANANPTNTAYVTVPTITFGQPASGATRGAYQMFLKSGIRDARNITINCTTDPNNNFARFVQECTQLYYSPHFNFNVLTTSDALRNAVNQSNQLHLIYGNVPQMGAVTNQWTYGVTNKGVFCTNSTLTIRRNAQGATQANSDYIPTLWSIADLNGKLYAPVVTESNGVVTIVEYEGGASCEIYYTTDGTTPTPSTGTLYTQPFVIASGDVVKAMAHFALDTDAGVTDSDITTYTA